jgi:hypothetical protein
MGAGVVGNKQSVPSKYGRILGRREVFTMSNLLKINEVSL